MVSLKLHFLNCITFAILFLHFFVSYAQPDVRKKGFYNPAISDVRVNTEEKKTFIKGKVLDRLSNEPLIGATVKLNPKGFISYTDLNGYFEFLNLPPDTFEIEVNYIGYKKTKFSEISTIEKQLVQLILPIEILVSEMEGVVIESEIPKLSELSAIMLQKNSNFIADAQSGNQIEKENFDYSVSTGFQRMNGASFAGNHSYIRGLPEKYNAILLNNAPFISLNSQKYFYNLQEFPTSVISSVSIFKSTTSEYYANYGGGLVLLETEQMPDASKFKIQWNGFYNSNTTFQKLHSLPFNKRMLLIPETQNIKIHFKELRNPSPINIPNYYTNRNYTALPSTQWSGYFSNRYSVLNNRDLGFVAAVNFWDHYERMNISGSNLLNLSKDTLYTTNINNSFQDKHHQNVTAIANASLKWNNKNFLHSKNTLIYKNINQVYSQSTDSNVYRSQSYERNFTFAQQNSGQHSLVARKNRSLRMEWLQFYHYYYQQNPAMINYNFQKHLSGESYLALPSTSTISNSKLYHNNTIYAEKQQVHQVGGDVFFDIMVKEEDNKVKTRIGTFLNFTHSQFNSRNFHYNLNNSFNDSSLISMNQILNQGIVNNGNETLFSLNELTDTSNLYQAQHFNIAPYINIQYELTEIFHFVVGFREDFSIRKLSNVNNSNLLQRAFQSDLPSLSIIFRTHEKSQLRFNYMMSVSRPTDRDFMGSKFYHPLTQILHLPNPQLMPSTINHLDARFEVFPTNIDAFSINLFFKQIHFPIENQYSLPKDPQEVITSRTSNSNAAMVGGLEWEWKQNLGNIWDSFIFEKFYLYLNGYASVSNSKPQSQTKFFAKDTRPLQGHSNYGLNLGFNWAHEDLGLKIMTFVNHKGKNIFLAHSNNPQWDIWELQRTDWSFQVSKSFQSHWEFRLALFNLLDQPIRWAYLNQNHYFKNDIKQTFREQKLGRQFLVSVNYRL